MVKKIICIFFLSVFLIQLLPLKQVGQLIAGATMTEELPEKSSSKSGLADIKWLIDTGHHFDNDSLNTTGRFLYIHFSETLPILLASDVQTPPPNLFC